MKKYELLKIIGISFLVVVGLSWIIPTGMYSEGTFTGGETSPLGLFDLIRTPLSTVSNLIQYAIIFLLIGGLYGVINKTGAYSSFVDHIVKRFKDKERNFLIATIIIFAVLSSLTALIFPLFVIVPFFVTVLLSMHYSKKTALMATVGAILIGIIGSTYGFNINGYINYYFSLDVHNEIITKTIFLAIITYLTVLFVLRTSKNDFKVETKKSTKKDEKKEEKHDEKVVIPLFEKGSKNKKSHWPLFIVLLVTVLVLLLGMYNWQYSLGVTFFNDIHASIMGLEVAGYPLVQNLIGNINPMGNWSIYEMSIILLAITLLIGWLYNLKVVEIIDGFVKGAKEMLPTAFYVTIANVVFVVIASSQTGGNIVYTITNYLFGLTENLNIVTMAIATGISSFFYNDFTNLFNALGSNIAIIYPNASMYPVIGLVSRTMYGLVMFVAPTSLLLIAGLSYLKIPYIEWVKYIWKFLLQVLGIAVVIMIIMLMFV